MNSRLGGTVLLGVLVIGLLAGGGCGPAAQPEAGTRDGVFVHIKSGPDEPHSVLMGLRMAQMMSADRDVLVYVDVEGIRAVLKDSPDLEMAPFGSSRAMIQDLVDRKVPIYACPGCLAALGKHPDQLLPGVAVAEPGPFFAFTRGRILTLDY